MRTSGLGTNDKTRGTLRSICFSSMSLQMRQTTATLGSSGAFGIYQGYHIGSQAVERKRQADRQVERGVIIMAFLMRCAALPAGLLIRRGSPGCSFPFCATTKKMTGVCVTLCDGWNKARRRSSTERSQSDLMVVSRCCAHREKQKNAAWCVQRYQRYDNSLPAVVYPKLSSPIVSFPPPPT